MTHRLVPGASRRAVAAFSDSFPDLPAPPGELFRQIIAVEEVCLPGAAYAPPPLEWLALFLTLHGRAELRIGTQTLTHQPGSLIAVASGETIQEQVLSDQPWHLQYLLLTGPWADSMDAWLHDREPPVLVWTAAPQRRRQIVGEMVDLALTQERGWQWPFLSRCAELWGTLYIDATAASPGESLVFQLGRLLDESPAERLSLAELAALVHLTPRQLIYRFQSETGEPIAQWVRRRRIASARRLLSQGWSVSSVAEQLGFANPYHFSRTFKAVTGIAPSTMREDARRSELHTRTVHDRGRRKD